MMILLLATTAWAGADEDWTLDTSGDVSISRDADNTIKDESYSNEVTPRLAFVCSGGSITAQIDWKRFISSFSTEVGFKVDDGKFTWLKWKVDDSEKVTLSPSAADTQTLTDVIGNGSRLIVDITPYSEGPMVVEFDLAGFTDTIGKLKSSCQ